MGSHQKETRTLVKNVEEETMETKGKIHKMMGLIDDVDKKVDATNNKIELILSRLDKMIKGKGHEKRERCNSGASR